MIVIMAMIVTAMCIVDMIMRMIVDMAFHRLRRVGAAFRFERGVERRDLGAKRCQQDLDRGLPLDADAVWQ